MEQVEKIIISELEPEKTNVAWYQPSSKKTRFFVNGEWQEPVDKDSQADWNEASSTSPAYIKNKPTIPEAQIQSDWNQADNTKADYIKNKPNLALFPVIMDVRNIQDWGDNDNPAEYTYQQFDALCGDGMGEFYKEMSEAYRITHVLDPDCFYPLEIDPSTHGDMVAASGPSGIRYVTFESEVIYCQLVV